MQARSAKDEAAMTLDAYERWAPHYRAVPHNPLMCVEQNAMLEEWPRIEGRRALDLACGSGRYARLLAQSGAATVVALDFSFGMLRQFSNGCRVRASMMQLPFAGGVFGAVVCGLALGHATDIARWMSEIARVLEPGGTLLYSDFHPEAARAGLTRSFKDEGGMTVTLPHRRFSVESQKQAAATAGLSVSSIRELRVGHELREPFRGSDEFYARWNGLPLVLVVRASR